LNANSNNDVSVIAGSLPQIQGKVLFNEPMASRASFKIGGPADILVSPADASELQALLKWARANQVPVFSLGAGTNLLVSDRGIRGMVVQLGAGFRHVHVQGTKVVAGSAVTLPMLLRRALGSGLSGLECLAGIPGTVGGAICMNAGTHAGCIKDSLEEVTAFDADGEMHVLTPDELGMSYRHSRIRELGLIVLETSFNLQAEKPETIQSIVTSLMGRRRGTQPVGIGTAGSVFKNPEGGYAGRILEEAGAKGMQVGGARVSGKHANFIENTGEASAEDVRQLMTQLQDLVKEKAGILLEPEIQMVGEW
jgi:UDP-N-acetylmuramate dehydrogenase